jgi:hypothetical protein
MAKAKNKFKKAQSLMQDKGLTAEQASKRTGVNVGRLGGSTPSTTTTTTTTKGPVGSTGSASSNAFSGTPAQQMFSTETKSTGKQKEQNPLRAQLSKLKESGRSLSGKQALKISEATGVRGGRLIDTATKMGIGVKGSAVRRYQKGQLSTPEEGLLSMVFDNQLPDRNGGFTGSGIPAALDPRSQNELALQGLDLKPGQRFMGATASGEPILATKDMLGGGRRRGGGAGEPEVTADPAVAEEPAGSGPIPPEEEEEDTTDGGLMTGSVEAGRSALGIKRRRSRAQRLRLAQLGTSRLNRLKIRSMLNLRGAGGITGLV